ncbi:hypothetical protein [uncultured Rhodoblastus sp.]|uniref:hypothetical protein n=1 Tax=uncultured Rhodoblastus sp. TaxID=543037 RepID=UPI0025FD3858|nr:hypothetical protein [uncultured Rhodoblastus sp.]
MTRLSSLVLIAAAAGFIKSATATFEEPQSESVAPVLSTIPKIKIATSSGDIVYVSFSGAKIKNKKSATPENKMSTLHVVMIDFKSSQRMPRAPPN